MQTRFTLGNAEVLSVGRWLWRVRDTRRPVDDALCVLGFIEQNGVVFDVVPMRDPGHPIPCGDLNDAIRLLEASATDLAAVPSSGPGASVPIDTP